MHSLWKFTRDILFTFEFWGGMLLLNGLNMHFHFSTIEVMMTGGGFGMLISNYLTKKTRPIIIHITLPDIPQKD